MTSDLFYEPIEPVTCPPDVLTLATAFKRDLLAYWQELKPTLPDQDRPKARVMAKVLLSAWLDNRWAAGGYARLHEALFVSDNTNNKENELRVDVTVHISYGHIFRWSLT
jgi:hypothetical protein